MTDCRRAVNAPQQSLGAVTLRDQSFTNTNTVDFLSNVKPPQLFRKWLRRAWNRHCESHVTLPCLLVIEPCRAGIALCTSRREDELVWKGGGLVGCLIYGSKGWILSHGWWVWVLCVRSHTWGCAAVVFGDEGFVLFLFFGDRLGVGGCVGSGVWALSAASWAWQEGMRGCHDNRILFG